MNFRNPKGHFLRRAPFYYSMVFWLVMFALSRSILVSVSNNEAESRQEVIELVNEMSSDEQISILNRLSEYEDVALSRLLGTYSTVITPTTITENDDLGTLNARYYALNDGLAILYPPNIIDVYNFKDGLNSTIKLPDSLEFARESVGNYVDDYSSFNHSGFLAILVEKENSNQKQIFYLNTSKSLTPRVPPSRTPRIYAKQNMTYVGNFGYSLGDTLAEKYSSMDRLRLGPTGLVGYNSDSKQMEVTVASHFHGLKENYRDTSFLSPTREFHYVNSKVVYEIQKGENTVLNVLNTEPWPSIYLHRTTLPTVSDDFGISEMDFFHSTNSPNETVFLALVSDKKIFYCSESGTRWKPVPEKILPNGITGISVVNDGWNTQYLAVNGQHESYVAELGFKDDSLSLENIQTINHKSNYIDHIFCNDLGLFVLQNHAFKSKSDLYKMVGTNGFEKIDSIVGLSHKFGPFGTRRLHNVMRSKLGLGLFRVTYEDGNQTSRTVTTLKINWNKINFSARKSVNPYLIAVLFAFILSLFILGLVVVKDVVQPHEIEAVEALGSSINLNGTLVEINLILNQLRIRYDSMLYLGITLAVFGIGVFLIMIGELQSSNNETFQFSRLSDLLSVLKPVSVLLFIESISFFFLRQYRLVFLEYKKFMEVKMKLRNYLHFLELHNDYSNDVSIKDLAKDYLNSVYNLSTVAGAVNQESGMKEILLKFMDKIPNK